MATPFDQDVNSSVEGTEQAPRQLGGFDCEFVERPPEAFQVDCPICLSVLREPHQVTCCGYSYCQSCIERVQLQKSPCPTCNGADFSVFPNKGLKRSLYAFKVQCSHKKEGCQWTGELGNLDKHLNVNPKVQEQLTGCEFARVECHHCCELYQRRYVTAHQTKECIRRPFNCHFCDNYGADFEDVTIKHWPVCGFYPVSCPNKCGVYLERQYLEHHVTKDCPLAVVDCDFHYAGCEVQLPRKDMPAHLAENLVVHMSLMAVQNREVIIKLRDELAENTRKIKALERENEALKRSLEQKTKEIEHKLDPVLPSLPVEFTMTDFEQYKRNKEIWYSPPFYSHPRGYKMCLKVNPTAANRGFIAVGPCMMQGEFDHVLKWPFEHSTALEIVNQLQDSGHYRLPVSFFGTQKACRVTDGERAKEGSCGAVPYDKLNYDSTNHCHYLKNDCLRIRVTHVITLDVLQLQRRCLAIESRICLCPIEFTMTNFKHFKEEHSRWFSPSFYTHTRGYRVCLEVSACESRHIAAIVHLMQGEFDNSLKWPFRGDITIQLLNQLQNKGHYEKTIAFTDKTPDCAGGRVTAWVMNIGWAFQDFLSYNVLDYQYLYNDCLRFRVTAKVK